LPALLLALLSALPGVAGAGRALAPTIPPEAAGDEAPPSGVPASTIADAFIGEALDYSIGFWFFKSVATGRLTFKRGADGGYEATLRAHANGVADKLLKHRRDEYTSYMYLSEDGTMFLTKRFERVIVTSEKEKVKKKYVDYKNRIFTWMKWENGEERGAEAVGFPRGIIPVDPLAAFYNFRAGAYGPLKPGGEYKIPALPKNGRVPEIYFRIITDAEMAERKGKSGSEFIVDALIGKDLFGSEKGEMEIFFDSRFVPVYAVAKGVEYLGNVRGVLVGEERPAGAAAPVRAVAGGE
jgi:hypothetical protein